jgi:hypothetical protein
MPVTTTFNAAKISALAERIEKEENEAFRLRAIANQASGEANRQEVVVANLKAEFSRLVNDHLDFRTLRDPNPPRPVDR